MTKLLTKEEIFPRVRAIITKQMSVTGNPQDPFQQKVTLEAKLEEDLEVDSLDRVELTMAYEEEFDIELDENEDRACNTVGEQVDRLHAVLTAKAG